MFLDKAKLYNDTNCMQRKDAEDTLNEYASKIKWLPGGGDSILHIGSRSGDVLFDFVFPLLPKSFNRLVGIDKSAAMISYANENYRHPKSFFEVADIVNPVDVDKLKDKYGQFDHVVSLCSLHWLMDQQISFKRIFDLMTPYGDILLTICASHPLYEHYSDMILSEKWSDYRQQMKLSTSPYFGCADPVKMLKDIMEKAGFQYVQVEMKERLFHYDKQVFIDSTSISAPFLCHAPDTLRIEFLRTYENKVAMMSQNRNRKHKNSKISVPYRMLFAYGKKGNGIDTHNTINITNNNTKEDNTNTKTHAVLKDDEVRMHNARSYHATNCMQRKDASDTIIEYQSIFQWSPDGDDLLLDIGIGSGDVTYDFILPILPEKSRIIASDKSEEMIEYAESKFPHERISYEKLDIESENDVNEVLRKYGQVHHVTSFCCLHWAQKQYLVMENIFHLLQPGGDVLMTICQHHPLYEHYADMSELPKWSKYRPDMKKSTTPYFRNEDPEKELYMRMERAGFVDINVILKRRIFHFDNQVFIDSTVPVAPFLDKKSETLKSEFLQIYINKVLTMKLPPPYKPNKERNDGKTIIPFCMLLAYARKPSVEDTRV